MAQLAAAGLSRSQLRQLIKRGDLTPIRRGVYVLTALAEYVRGNSVGEHVLHLRAIQAEAGIKSVASHESAALIHGLDVFGRPRPELVTLTHPRSALGSRSGGPGVRVHAAELPAGDVMRQHGVFITTVARTVVDLARTSSFRDGVVVADSALHGMKATKADLEVVVAACRRWPGVQLAKRVVAFSDHRSESVLESISRVAFHEQGLPPPNLQVRLGGDLGFVGRVDFFWPQHKTVGEADGAVKYADTRRAMAQLERDKLLRQAGFEVVHFTYRNIIHAPAAVARDFRSAFTRGDALP